MIEGPRGSGKSTILRALVAELGGSVVDLDDPLVLAEIRAGAEGPFAVAQPDRYRRVPACA